MKFILVIFFFLFSSPILFSQQAAHFFLGEDRFEGVQIYDVIQDKKLNYWFATDQGFYKYDSYTFEKISCPGMKGSSAFGFVMNHNGIIFCYNLNNQILKIENNACTVLYELKEKERASDIYLTITNDNNLLVLTRTVLLFDQSGNQINTGSIPYNYYGFPFLTSKGETISHTKEHDSLLVLEGSGFKIVHLKNKSEPIKGVLKFFKIGKKTYAISTEDKTIYSFNEEKYELNALEENILLNRDEFLRFYNENDQLWIAGTVSGVQLLTDPESKQLTKVLYSNYLVSDIFKDNEGNMLLSTFNHGVIVIPNLKIPDVLPLPKNHSIVSIHYDKDFGMLMGTLRGQLLSFQNDQYKTLSANGNRPLQAVYSWPGFNYIIFDDGSVKAYNKTTGKIIPLLEGSLKDAILLDEHNLCLALNLGICKLTLEGNDSFKKQYNDSLKIRSNSLEVEPGTHNIYVATSDGLKILKPNGKINNVLYNGTPVFANDITTDGKQIFVSTKQETILLFKNGSVVQSIVPKLNQKGIEFSKLTVKDDKIYTLSTEGFAVFHFDGSVLMQLNKVHGFSTNKIFDFEIINDQFWICHSKGVQKLSTQLLGNRLEEPLISFTDISVNDTSISNFVSGNFNSDQRKFRFKVSSPSIRNKENISYHFKLIGYDDKWSIQNYANNEIVYNALGSGNYTLVVKAENHGLYSEAISYSFTIAQPIYMDWWFILTAAILVFVIITFMYRYKLNVQRKKSEQINELNVSKLTAIQSQMNPHFIFNSLNSIQDLILKGDVEHSYSYITTFANLVRRTLNYSEKDFIDFDQEIKLLELYLSLEKLRFKKDLNYSINFKNIDDIMIPPLLVQPFIENCLVHGLLHKEGQKQLNISFELKEQLICTIEDNGVGREKAKAIKQRQRSEHESFSGKAIHKRFEILSNVFGGNFGYVYEDLYHNNEATGTRVILTIPIKHKF